jgi:hypothetical protein
MTGSQPLNDGQRPDAGSQDDVERRAILKRLGVLAALTPPAVVTILMPARASAGS